MSSIQDEFDTEMNELEENLNDNTPLNQTNNTQKFNGNNALGVNRKNFVGRNSRRDDNTESQTISASKTTTINNDEDVEEENSRTEDSGGGYSLNKIRAFGGVLVVCIIALYYAIFKYQTPAPSQVLSHGCKEIDEISSRVVFDTSSRIQIVSNPYNANHSHILTFHTLYPSPSNSNQPFLFSCKMRKKNNETLFHGGCSHFIHVHVYNTSYNNQNLSFDTHSPSHAVPCNVTIEDNLNGTYKISLQFPERGIYVVHVLWAKGDQHIGKSFLNSLIRKVISNKDMEDSTNGEEEGDRDASTTKVHDSTIWGDLTDLNWSPFFVQVE